MSWNSIRVALVTLSLVVGRLGAQVASPGQGSPEELAARVMERFASGTAAAFDSVYPDSSGRAVVRMAIERQVARRADLARVLWRAPGQAILLLAGTTVLGDAGMETLTSLDLSGFYEAVESGGRWAISRQLPFDSANYIRAQTLQVRLQPGREIHVVDTLELAVGVSYGMAVRLNTAARVLAVRIGGKPAEYAFGGGLLWIRAPRRPRVQVVVTYTLREAVGAEGNRLARDSTSFDADGQPGYGDYRNVDVWHPFLGFDSANDRATLSVAVRLPAQYHLTTSVSQTESVQHGTRIVRGRSTRPEFLLALLYDRSWTPRSAEVGGIRVDTYFTDGFRVSHDSTIAALDRICRSLCTRFGVPARHIVVAEARGFGKVGFLNRVNDIVVSGTDASSAGAWLSSGRPGYVFAHETAHGWTMNATGPAANFLREGWARFAESVVLRDHHGPEVERAFWEQVRNHYIVMLEGRGSILGNRGNNIIHYSKGSWLFRSLNQVLGDSVFQRGIRRYVRRQLAGMAAGYQELVASMSAEAGRDLTSFVMPWLTGTVIPDIGARVDGSRIIVTQRQPGFRFDLPLQLDLTTAAGRVRRMIHLTESEATLDVSDLGTITGVHVDPDRQFLLRRPAGEMVRFELHAPEAKAVELLGNFTAKPIPAERSGETWTVEIPMDEGEYVWTWQIDRIAFWPNNSSADPAKGGIRFVRPIQPLTQPYPRPR